MSGLAITRHGAARMAQRGVRKRDLDLLLAYGTDIGSDRIMLRRREAARAIRELKGRGSNGHTEPAVWKLVAAVERLVGKVIVVADGALITTYHQTVRFHSRRRRTSQPISRKLGDAPKGPPFSK